MTSHPWHSFPSRPLQLSSLASSTVTGKSATRGLESHPDYHTYSKASVSAVERAPEKEKNKPHNSCTDTEQKAVPPRQAAQVPAAGMGPCGSLQGWQRSQGRNLAFSRTPGSVFLLSIFLNLTYILFFSEGREPHSGTFQRCVGHLVFQTS